MSYRRRRSGTERGRWGEAGAEGRWSGSWEQGEDTVVWAVRSARGQSRSPHFIHLSRAGRPASYLAEPLLYPSERVFKGSCLLMFLVLTSRLLVHKREARERREGNPTSPAGCLLAALVKGLLWRKLKILIKIRLPFTEARRSQLCFPWTHYLRREDPSQRLCVIQKVILHGLSGGLRQFSHLAGGCVSLLATPPKWVQQQRTQVWVEWREVAVIQVIWPHGMPLHNIDFAARAHKALC